MNEITKDIKQGLPWEILFADDLILMASTEEELKAKLNLWKNKLEDNGMKVNIEKTKIMECNRKTKPEEPKTIRWPCAICKKGVGTSSIQCTKCHMWVHRRCSGTTTALTKLKASFICSICSGQKKPGTLNDKVFNLTQDIQLEKVTTFSYLGDKIQANGGAQEAVRNRIRAAWAKWREVAALLLKKEIALKNRALAYKIYIRSALIYGSETWALKATDESALLRTELRMLRWMIGGANNPNKSEKLVREATNVESIVAAIQNHRLKWYGHVMRRKDECWIRKCLTMDVEGKRERGRPAKCWMDLVKGDLKAKGLEPEDAAKRVQWRTGLRAKRPNPSN